MTKKVLVHQSKETDLLVSKMLPSISLKALRVAYEYEYFNAAGVLIVHAAIAIADALTIKKGGLKCKGGNHFEVINLIREIIEQDSKAKAVVNHLEAIISFKNDVSYSGDIYLKSDIDKLSKHFTRFYNWAEHILIS